ncbi:hypothetical protein N7505_006835 [Penicillium chrysogenum]|uniref:Uncharacterized protein n=1 Tax=Penicillium chrysogenum TaxID=5076 RepID=A0ABQ8WMU5_PENCH|nr:hypothetical protein N7505_006835 [Penicillium chrysogenum]
MNTQGQFPAEHEPFLHDMRKGSFKSPWSKRPLTGDAYTIVSAPAQRAYFDALAGRQSLKRTNGMIVKRDQHCTSYSWMNSAHREDGS